MIDKKLTEKQEIASISADALIHVVEPNNLTQGPEGSSFKFKASNLSMAGQDNIDIRKYVTITATDTMAEIVDKVNSLSPYTVDEKQSVWIITRQKPTGIGPIDGGYTPQRTLKFKVLNNGKGTYGDGYLQLAENDLELLYDNTESTSDIITDPTTDIVSFGEIDGQNISQWLNTRNPAIVIQGQNEGYTIFNGVVDGEEITYLWIGVAGVYGIGESDSTMADFQALSDEAPGPLGFEDVLTVDNVSAVPAIIQTGDKATEYRGDGSTMTDDNGHTKTHAYATPTQDATWTWPDKGDDTPAFLSDVNGLTLEVNQAAAEVYLKNLEGETLATISVGFLNNEGTTFFYNDVTGNLELKDEEGNVLSTIPVSAFVSNLVSTANFNGVTASTLDFKNSTGTIVFSVSFSISNISGLQAALDALVVPDATTSIKGKIQLAGDLAGDASAPVLNKISSMADPDETIIPGVLPDGTLQKQNTMIAFLYDDTITDATIASEVAALYPTSAGYRQGFVVRCRNASPKCWWIKDNVGDDGWSKLTIS